MQISSVAADNQLVKLVRRGAIALYEGKTVVALVRSHPCKVACGGVIVFNIYCTK
ncbi:hypothetical protein PI95_012975 [Hassallia byssoidea VB512170]|uniref:Uncharacterized protein n=1 Tax=Hassallia byssoidea VB512170 TaxID=1304833 RepID=A0A846HAG7_9CYAN|nr:hypothetical protein [Hassalia byssoidea]NEU73451.1 hypothetical protein [Hassalia byssoidea VB512170]